MFAISHAVQSAESHLDHEIVFAHHQLAHGIAHFDPDEQLATEARLSRLVAAIAQMADLSIALLDALLLDVYPDDQPWQDDDRDLGDMEYTDTQLEAMSASVSTTCCACNIPGCTADCLPF